MIKQFIFVLVLYFGITTSAYPKSPETTHPRIYGNNLDFWNSKIQPFFDLPCDTTFAKSDFSLLSVRQAFEWILYSGSICKAPARKTVFDVNHNTVKDYYLASPPAWNSANRDITGRNAMYLVRFLRSCLALDKGAQYCVYNQSQLDDLIPRVINLEWSFWSNWGANWYSYNEFGFDLGSRAPSKFWSLFYDTFYSQLSSDQKTTIETKLDLMMNNYNKCFLSSLCWPLQNGNNWTPYLSAGAAYLSLARWYENATVAQTTMADILLILNKTKPMLVSDGTFVEGIAHYTSMNADNLLEIEFLVQYNLNTHVTNFDWDMFKKTGQWIVDNLLSDTFTLDFGDSHITQYSSITPLFSWYIDEILGKAKFGSTKVDPCLMLRFWQSHYYYGGLDSGFDLQPFVARNYSALVEGCTSLTDSTGFYPVGGSGMFKKRVAPPPNNTAIYLRGQQSSFSTLAIEAKYNGYPHTEADFGGIVYSAFGSRIIYDLSYGEIAKTDKALQYDNGAAGANTLVIENAWDPSNPTIINRSQFSPVRGTIDYKKVKSGSTIFEYFELDGSDVYGKSQTNGGWLKRFKRYGVSLPDGHYLILDSFTKKDNLASVNASEYFYSARDKSSPTTCGLWTSHTSMALVDGEIEIKPLCNNALYNENGGMSTTVSRIVGASLGGGKFVYDGVLTYSSAIDNPQTKFKARYLSSNALTGPEARAFLLVSGKTAATLPEHSVKVTSECPEGNKCFEIKISSKTYRAELKSDNDGYLLSCISSKESTFKTCTQISTTGKDEEDISKSSILSISFSLLLISLFILFI